MLIFMQDCCNMQSPYCSASETQGNETHVYVHVHVILKNCLFSMCIMFTSQQIKLMCTEYQFILISSPPAKEVEFQQAKLKHGSTYAFQ